MGGVRRDQSGRDRAGRRGRGGAEIAGCVGGAVGELEKREAGGS